jgi:hypothetical protein
MQRSQRELDCTRMPQRRCAGFASRWCTRRRSLHSHWDLLPGQLISPLDGSPIQVAAVRGGRLGHAQLGLNATNQSHEFLPGSLGAILRRKIDPSQLLALTAGHVVGAGIDSAVGDTVVFGFRDVALPPIRGRLLAWQPQFDPTPNQTDVDAGIAEVNAEGLRDLAARPSEWPIGTAMAFPTDRLRMRTSDGILAGDSMQRLSAWLSIDGDSSQSYHVPNALCWRTERATESGYSGAPIWNADDRLVAIHAGAAPEGAHLNAVAIAITPILKWAGAQIVRRGEPLLPKKRGASRKRKSKPG